MYRCLARDVSKNGERSRVSCLNVSSVSGSLASVCEVRGSITGCVWSQLEAATMSSESRIQHFVIQKRFCLYVAVISVKLLWYYWYLLIWSVIVKIYLLIIFLDWSASLHPRHTCCRDQSHQAAGLKPLSSLSPVHHDSTNLRQRSPSGSVIIWKMLLQKLKYPLLITHVSAPGMNFLFIGVSNVTGSIPATQHVSGKPEPEVARLLTSWWTAALAMP